MPTAVKQKLINIPHLVNSSILIIFAVIIGLGTWFAIKALTPDTIVVSGTSSSVMANQISTYSLSVEKSDTEKAAAVEALTVATKSITEAIKEFGIAPEDIETTNFNVYQRQDAVYSGGVTKYELGDWFASYTINAKLRDLSRSEEFTALLSNIEGASMWGPNLTIDEKEIDEETLLTAAIEDARSKAEAIATGLGKKIGKAVQISEGGASNVYFSGIRSEAMMGAGGGGIPIEPGSTETYKSVTVVFEIR